MRTTFKASNFSQEARLELQGAIIPPVSLLDQESFARLKCIKFIFGPCSAPNPTGDLTLPRFLNRLVGGISDGFKGGKAEAGAAAPLLTGCILKQVKISCRSVNFFNVHCVNFLTH